MKRKLRITKRFWIILIALIVTAAVALTGMLIMNSRLSSFHYKTVEGLRTEINANLASAGQTFTLPEFTGGKASYDNVEYKAYKSCPAEYLIVAVTIAEDGTETITVQLKKSSVTDGDLTDETAQFHALLQSILTAVDQNAYFDALQLLIAQNYNAEYGTSEVNYGSYNYFWMDSATVSALLITKSK